MARKIATYGVIVLVAIVALFAALEGPVFAQDPEPTPVPIPIIRQVDVGEKIAQEAEKLVGKYPYDPNRTPCQGAAVCTDIVILATYNAGVPIDSDPCDHSAMRGSTYQLSYFKGEAVSGANNELARHFEPNGSVNPPKVGDILIWNDHVAVVAQAKYVAPSVNIPGKFSEHVDITTVETGAGSGLKSIGNKNYRLTRKGVGWFFDRGPRYTKILGWGVIDGTPMGGLRPILTLPGQASPLEIVGPFLVVVAMIVVLALVLMVLAIIFGSDKSRRRAVMLAAQAGGELITWGPLIRWILIEGMKGALEWNLFIMILVFLANPILQEVVSLGWQEWITSETTLNNSTIAVLVAAFLVNNAVVVYMRAQKARREAGRKHDRWWVVVLLMVLVAVSGTFVLSLGTRTTWGAANPYTNVGETSIVEVITPALPEAVQPYIPRKVHLSVTGSKEPAPRLFPLPLTWWNGENFMLAPPEGVWQDIWDAGQSTGADPAYLLCLGSSESMTFWQNSGNVCSGVGACGPYQFMPGTWPSYSPWTEASRTSWPDAAYGAGNMVVKLRLDKQTSQAAHKARFTGSDGGLAWNTHGPQADYVWRCTMAVRKAIQ